VEEVGDSVVDGGFGLSGHLVNLMCSGWVE
jgi:hypothetical protein